MVRAAATARLRLRQVAHFPKLDPCGAIAQLGERLLCKQEVTGSIPVGSIGGIAWKSVCFGRQTVLGFGGEYRR